MTARNHAQPLMASSPLRALSIAIALALAPSLTGYLYLNPLRASLVTIGLPGIWAYYLCILLTHLTTLVWLLIGLRGEVRTFHWRNIAHYLTLDRVDWRGLLYVLPLFGVFLAIVAANLAWLGSPPTLALLAETAEMSSPLAGGLALAVLAATLLAEEAYFRVFLARKLAPLGNWDWIIGGVLWAVYHWYALPWPFFLTIPLSSGWLGMVVFKRRQNIYPVMLLHLLAIQAANLAAVLVAP